MVAARRQPELDSLVAEIAADGGIAVALAGDVQSEAFAQALVELAQTQFGRLDIAFNNAGTLGEMGPSTGISAQGWNEALSSNLTSAFLGAKHQLAAMQKNGAGSIIFTSTFVGHTFAFPGVAAYAASKSGLIGLTQALAAEYGPQGIRVNAILPGAFDGPRIQNVFEGRAKVSGQTVEQIRKEAMAVQSLKRLVDPRDIAALAVFLASDAAKSISGQMLPIDNDMQQAS